VARVSLRLSTATVSVCRRASVVMQRERLFCLGSRTQSACTSDSRAVWWENRQPVWTVLKRHHFTYCRRRCHDAVLNIRACSSRCFSWWRQRHDIAVAASCQCHLAVITPCGNSWYYSVIIVLRPSRTTPSQSTTQTRFSWILQIVAFQNSIRMTTTRSIQ